ncbi:MAG: glycosyltransferase family 4 protein [Acidimicrobiia bacterium]
MAIFASAFHPSLGGVEELCQRLAFEQRRSGGSALICTMRWPRSLPRLDTVDGTLVWRGRFVLPGADLRSTARFVVNGLPTVVRLVRQLRRSKVELVHVQCVSGNGLYAWLAARLLRLPLVVSLQGELYMDATGVYQRSKVLPWLLRQLLRRADAVTACSRQTLSEAEAFTGVELGGRGSVVYNGVSIEEFDGAVPERRERPFVFAIGRHVTQKGFDILIDAYARSGASASHDLVIAGDGPERGVLESLAADSGVAATVHFTGRTGRPRTAALFRGCDLFVLPSRHEPMGIVNLEAMAASKPVVATSVGGVPELVVDGVTGVLVPPEDGNALASAITSLLSDPYRAGSLGAAGRLRALQFDWPVIARQYAEVYERVV